MSEFQQIDALKRIANALEAIANHLDTLTVPPVCACGCEKGLHIPKCNTIRCKCERYTLPATALVSILNQQLIQTMDLKMVIATAAGLVGEKQEHSSIVKP